MALIKSEERRYRGAKRIASYPVAASTKIYRGGALEVNAGGYAVPASDAGSFIGLSDEEVDNTNGANGDRTVQVVIESQVELPIAAGGLTAAAIAEANTIEATADDTFALETGSAITGQTVGKPMAVLAADLVLCFMQGIHARSA